MTLPFSAGSMMQPQVDPWRQQLQQMYGGGLLGSRQGTQAFSGPSTHMAYAMSGQGRYANPEAQQPTVGQQPGFPGIVGSPGGGGIADMIRQVIEYQRGQSLLGGQSGQGARLQLPLTPGLAGRY
jgi:hypothetical protein